MDDLKIHDQKIILLVAPYHIQQAKLTIQFIRKNLSLHQLNIVAPIEVYDSLQHLIDINEFIDENKILNKTVFQTYYNNKFGKLDRSNWYYQQFLGFGYSLVSQNLQNYINWNSDTIPLKHIEFIKDGKYLLNRKTEHHLPYFEFISKIIKNANIENESYISEYMIYDVNYMKELIEIFAQLNTNKKWYENILDNIDIRHIFGSGFADFETYGTFMKTFHNDKFTSVHLNTCRFGKHLFNGKIPTIEELDAAANILNLDTISFENWE